MPDSFYKTSRYATDWIAYVIMNSRCSPNTDVKQNVVGLLVTDISQSARVSGIDLKKRLEQ